MSIDKLPGIASRFNDADNELLIYNGAIYRPKDQEIIELCENKDRKENITVLLVTEGGDPDAAYRISRCLQDRYEQFTCIVSGYCKSAGTLLAVGAHEVVFGRHGELGPIDMQMSKKDELFETQSGLTVMASLRSLHERGLSAFEHFFLNIRRRSQEQITTKTTSEIASSMVGRLFAPIYAQIDPIHLGEAERETAIAREYARRLARKSENISFDNIDRMIGQFPSHGFAIDCVEAAALFNNVREPNELEGELIDALGDLAIVPRSANLKPYIEQVKGAANGPDQKRTRNPKRKRQARTATNSGHEHRAERGSENNGRIVQQS